MSLPLRNPVLVTGGAGFVGSHLARALLRLGYDVHVLDNLSTGKKANLPGGATFHPADLRSDGDLRAVFAAARFGAIVHCAAQTSVARCCRPSILLFYVTDSCRVLPNLSLKLVSVGGAVIDYDDLIRPVGLFEN